MEPIIFVAIVAIVAALIVWPFARPMFRKWRIDREARAMMRARFPGMRELPLSREDKRGWVIDKKGARPR
ncbi:hypothetical protein SB768_25370 [Burkholderia sp. SIMBA_043]|jgi:hypothetical protein|uniref:hypothetical protein n=1 Tax=Burkholderia TaxID=32008 RepID=UPI0005D8B077|nr:hypothetical protein [Burkholderia vietnamiensis]AJY03000.1 hypothetical protein AK36_6150 [Burkholderia vietnamiensis LMG 10929]AVR13914.1 hypothetical protein A8H33_10110 [Burkholderia vietnamiensis]KVM41643.1 hypothetical protein WJ57_29595 [Burkholderia vietnamiensis]KVS03832.1 hypothetical protein WK30_10695 [Burkholderia vietnamiensis]UBI29224.1 hypothetical protein LA325_30985 [Burkholderia vietnamiensis]